MEGGRRPTKPRTGSAAYTSRYLTKSQFQSISSGRPPLSTLSTLLRLTSIDTKIAIEADMSHAGMSPVFAHLKESEPGRYQTGLEFPMAGDWVVLLHITLPDGKKLERQIDVKGVRPN